MADELVIQLAIIGGPDFIDSAKKEIEKENRLDSVQCPMDTNSLMEKLSREYPILPSQTLSQLIIQVLAAANAPTKTSRAETRSLEISYSEEEQTDEPEEAMESSEIPTDEAEEVFESFNIPGIENSAEIEDIDDTEDTNEMKDTNKMEDTNEIEDSAEMEDMDDREDTNEMKDTTQMEDTNNIEGSPEMEDTETDKMKDEDESSDTSESSAVQQRSPYSEEKPTSERDEADAEEVEYLLDFPVSWSQNYADAQSPQSPEEQTFFPQTQNQWPQVQSKYKENSKYMKNHQVCQICFREKHKRQQSCPVIVLYNASASARMPNHICITCLSRRTSSCPARCGWDKVTKRPKFCVRHSRRIRIHRDICKKCHKKKSQCVVGLKKSNGLNTSSGKSTSLKTGTATSTGTPTSTSLGSDTRKSTFVSTSRNTMKSTDRITQISNWSISTSTSNRGITSKLDCQKMENQIKEAMMATLQNSLQN